MQIAKKGQEQRNSHHTLHHIPGASKFADLKTTPDGVIYKTFKETALALGLLESDEDWEKCMSEAAVSFMPKQLHSMFVTILIFGDPARPHVLWEKYKDALGEDLMRYVVKSSQDQMTDLAQCVDNEVLFLLQDKLEDMGTNLENYGLPTPNKTQRIEMLP